VLADGSQSGGGGGFQSPGTQTGASSNGGGNLGHASSIFATENGASANANGGQFQNNGYTVDGISTVSAVWGGSTVVTPSEDSVSNVKIVTNAYDAENGRYRGAQVQIISQNGTNQYHGSLFFKAHRPGLDARTKYNGYNNGNVRDANRFNNWGGSAGGPILKNKLFAFFSYERLDNNAAGATTSGWYETSQFRALAATGTNAAKIFGFPGAGPNGGTIVDQTCASIGLTEGTNCHFIAGQGLNLGSPLTIGLGKNDPAYTSNTSPGTGGNGLGGASNLGTTPDIAFYTGILNPTNSSHVQYNGRVDFNATSRDLIAFSIYYVPNSSTSINGACDNGGCGDRLANNFNSTSINRAATALWDHTFSSSLVNEARINAIEIEWFDRDALRQREPMVEGVAAIFVQATGMPVR